MYDAQGIFIRLMLSVLGSIIVLVVYKFMGIGFAIALCGAMSFTSLILSSDR